MFVLIIRKGRDSVLFLLFRKKLFSGIDLMFMVFNDTDYKILILGFMTLVTRFY